MSESIGALIKLGYRPNRRGGLKEASPLELGAAVSWEPPRHDLAQGDELFRNQGSFVIDIIVYIMAHQGLSMGES